MSVCEGGDDAVAMQKDPPKRVRRLIHWDGTRNTTGFRLLVPDGCHSAMCV